MPKNSWREATGFNHRSTDIKSAGTWMNNMLGSGAESSLHRRKVGGGQLGSGVKMHPYEQDFRFFSRWPRRMNYNAYLWRATLRPARGRGWGRTG